MRLLTRLFARDVPSREPIAVLLISAEINYARGTIFSTERQQPAISTPREPRDRRIAGLARQHLSAVVDAHEQNETIGIADRHHGLLRVTRHCLHVMLRRR